ncbi:hypothetical protein C5167_032141 [Papaver somniferum]|uniref:Uncharacterized protein n=1 Tax=Papaver somniferum TaxID=3469 RepID=A0A4Y7K6S2_PAPSO|nr:hypothetical protein C5167_032141 [Papaver somniferum]
MGGVKPRISIFFRLDSTITGLNINQTIAQKFHNIGILSTVSQDPTLGILFPTLTN